MWSLSSILRARRMRRGALDFDLPEAKVILDPTTGAPLDVQKRSHDPGVVKAYHLIEELMLLANETMARFVVERDVPTIFRDHAPPDEAKLDRCRCQPGAPDRDIVGGRIQDRSDLVLD